MSEADSKQTLKVLEAMTHAIKKEFRYNARHEEGTQTAAETLALGSGTCRDFAVLMMEALRSFGLATRFVTGYLYDDTSGTTRGGGSTHAWCSVYLPGAGWVEYDPTNGLIAGANLIRVGVDQGGRAGAADIGWLYRQCGRSDRAARRCIGPRRTDTLSATTWLVRGASQFSNFRDSHSTAAMKATRDTERLTVALPILNFGASPSVSSHDLFHIDIHYRD